MVKMKLTSKTSALTFLLILILATLGLGQACSQQGFMTAGTTTASSTDTTSSQPPIGSSVSKCTLPAGVSGSPQTIEDLVALINALPKPTSVPCLLEVLDRPLKLALTNSTFSVQPAVGDRSPRIFIFIGDLEMSVVPEGAGAKSIELGYRNGTFTSIKAALDFPVTDALTPDAPYKGIAYNGQTSCVFCHNNEMRMNSITFAEAYTSRVLRPFDNTLVTLDTAKSNTASCDPLKEPTRCAILNSIFSNGEVQSQPFPLNLGTLF